MIVTTRMIIQRPTIAILNPQDSNFLDGRLSTRENPILTAAWVGGRNYRALPAPGVFFSKILQRAPFLLHFLLAEI